MQVREYHVFDVSREFTLFVIVYVDIARIALKRTGTLGDRIFRNVTTFHGPAINTSNLIAKKPPRKHFDSDYKGKP